VGGLHAESIAGNPHPIAHHGALFRLKPDLAFFPRVEANQHRDPVMRDDPTGLARFGQRETRSLRRLVLDAGSTPLLLPS
jgi:hypothetical protein